MNIDSHLSVISEVVKNVTQDPRDQWPIDLKSYVKGENLANGYFGTVRFAECRDLIFGFDGLEIRRCVMKTIYLQRRFAAIFPKSGEHGNSITSTSSTTSLQLTSSHSVTAKERLFRFYRKIILELYVLNRCRHENILHSHAVFLSDFDLHIIMPRTYVLENLIQMYRVRNNSEPIQVKIIAIIIRQLCFALDYLFKVGIIHRDVQPQNVFLTRGGTVKLAHFGQSAVLFPDNESTVCRTPVGRKEFMCYEKLHNIYRCKSLEECVPYSYSADIWSLGVLTLTMVTYFPNEKGHKLSEDFAMIMQNEKMPFIWLTVEMLQLRARIVKSGGEDLKIFLSDYLLTVSAKKRATAESLPKTPQMMKWCAKTVDEDKIFLRKYFINEVDFANRFKLEDGAPNYEYLETKNIPAEFYWNEKWIILESSCFLLKMNYSPPLLASGENFATFCESQVHQFQRARNAPKTFADDFNNNISKHPKISEYRFQYSDAEPLFRFLYNEFLENRLKLTDLILVSGEINQLVCEIIDKIDPETSQASAIRKKRIILTPNPDSEDSNRDFVDISIEVISSQISEY